MKNPLLEHEDEFKQIIGSAVNNLVTDVKEQNGRDSQAVDIVNMFLTGIFVTAAEAIEKQIPESAKYIYTNLEALAKNKCEASIFESYENSGAPKFSASNIDEDNVPAAMNYFGQALAVSLTKTAIELPRKLQGAEVQLGGIEFLLINFLRTHFSNPQEVLNNLTAHAHKVLDGKTTVSH